MSRKLDRGFIKPSTRKSNYPYKQTGKKFDKKFEKRKGLIYIALDSCIVIDMMKMLRSNRPYNTYSQYFKGLRKLLNHSVFGKDHNYNKDGDIVFCILPHVLQELTDSNGEIYSSMQGFVKDRMVILEIDKEYQGSFEKKVSKISKKYCELGYFLGEDNLPTTDSLIVAESAIFNLNLLSRDHHICLDKKDRNPYEKIKRILEVNRRALSNDFDGKQAQPLRIDAFMREFDKEAIMPKFRNADYLNVGVQGIIYAINHRKLVPAKDLGLNE